MVAGINHITLAVSDVERSFRFYVDVLNCVPVAKWSRGAYLKNGDTWLALHQDESVERAERPDYTHFAFSCSAEDFRCAKEKIVQYGSEEWQSNRSEGDSFYFRDPDGHKLEIHVGNLETRLTSMRDNPWDGITFYV